MGTLEFDDLQRVGRMAAMAAASGVTKSAI